MNQLEPHAENPFNTINVARERAQKFVNDNIQRMISAANPHFATIISETGVLYNQFFGKLEQHETAFLDRVADTGKVNSKIHDFLNKVIDLEPSVLVKYKKNTTEYAEFYPYGLSEYHNINLSNALLKMNRVIAKCHLYATDIGASWEVDFTAIRDDFTDLLNEQEGKKGLVDSTSTELDQQYGPLWTQLFKNMHIILAEYASNPVRMLDFFDQTIVNFVSHVHESKIAPQSKKASDIHFTVEDVMKISNKTGRVLKFFFGQNLYDAPSGVIYTLAGNAKMIIQGSQTGAPNNTLLIFWNETDFEGKAEARIL